MGLFFLRMQFSDTEPPTRDQFRAALTGEVGTSAGLDDYSVRGNIVELTASLEPFTLPYAVKILRGLGGQQLDAVTRAPVSMDLPPYVERPWTSWPWWKRASIRARFVVGLVRSAGRGSAA